MKYATSISKRVFWILNRLNIFCEVNNRGSGGIYEGFAWC